MDLALLALLAALFSALCQSVTDLGTKAATRVADDRAILAVQWGSAALLLAIACCVVYPGFLDAPVATMASVTQPGFWTLLAWSGALNVTAYAFYIRSFRLSDASLVAPLVLLTPVLMLVTSPIMTGEHAPPMGMLGVLLTVLGVGLLDANRENGKRFNFSVFAKDVGARYMLATATVWSVTANIDKLGVKASTPLIWIASLCSVIALCSAAYWAVGARKTPRLAALRYAVMAGSALSIGTAVQMWALTILFTPYVIAIKRLSALFTVLASSHVLKEETGGRLFGAAVMLAGAVMIAMARG
ncbi:EamA family transporter [Methylocystis parvus]|uniref:EamA family transporter n=1 Tax=Methylocystis parvus TaxID=134 RepID=A0A6B8M9X2_9HYPH|nr:EamA family transporter [Methylocystis parvus]QGM98399.1 EamA family transporter [Methylocystis parvus]WBK01268.1 EamA family transporter [Methylocystis parvus OBBP]